MTDKKEAPTSASWARERSGRGGEDEGLLARGAGLLGRALAGLPLVLAVLVRPAALGALLVDADLGGVELRHAGLLFFGVWRFFEARFRTSACTKYTKTFILSRGGSHGKLSAIWSTTDVDPGVEVGLSRCV